jgi:GT2 family glycosyltransferase
VSDGARAVLPHLSVSIVSHGQGDLVLPLLDQLIALSAALPLQILLTENLAERRTVLPAAWRSNVRVLYNDVPLGFGANHNRAFAESLGRYFCVMNPDIRLRDNSILALLKCVERKPGVAGPRVVASNGVLQDSARKVPSILGLAWRAISGHRHADYNAAIQEQPVDWIAGMCLMFDRDSFAAVSGFTEDYRLYCEDVDVCIRMHLAGRSVSWVQHSNVVHDAHRDSHRSLRYLAWHVGSLLRLFTSKTYWEYRRSASH